MINIVQGLVRGAASQPAPVAVRNLERAMTSLAPEALANPAVMQSDDLEAAVNHLKEARSLQSLPGGLAEARAAAAAISSLLTVAGAGEPPAVSATEQQLLGAQQALALASSEGWEGTQALLTAATATAWLAEDLVDAIAIRKVEAAAKSLGQMVRHDGDWTRPDPFATEMARNAIRTALHRLRERSVSLPRPIALADPRQAASTRRAPARAATAVMASVACVIALAAFLLL